jgi:hypothetical protein
MDQETIQELVTRAAWLLPLFGAAAAALLAMVRRLVPSISGETAATVAGLLSGACCALGIMDLLPQAVYVVAAVLIAGPLPAVSYDLAARAGQAASYEKTLTEFDADAAGGPGAEGA